MIDYSALLYDPVYAEIGVPAVLTAAGTAGEVALTVIDDTKPKSQTSSGVEMRSVAPGAFARMPELIANGIVPDEFHGAMLTFNGRNWQVFNHEMGGNPNGEDFGQVRFLLKAVPAEALKDPPAGFAYLVNEDGAYLLNADNSYLLARV